MILQSNCNFLFNLINNFRNLYGQFWRNNEGFYKYYLKLDSYYYSNRKKCVIAIIRIRNKRTTDKIPICEIVNDKEYLKELHPVDACIIGMLANNERNGIVDKNSINWTKTHRSKEHKCSIKSEPILEVSRKYFTQNGNEIVVLRSKILNKEIEILTTELCKNQALLYSLDSFQTVAIGYDVSESIIRNSH